MLFSTAVQHERGPRNSTLRRQVERFYLKDSASSGSLTPPNFIAHQQATLLNLIATENRAATCPTTTVVPSPLSPMSLYGIRSQGPLCHPTPKVR